MQLRHGLALAVLLAHLLFLIWFFDYLPLTDLPGHLLLARVLVDYREPIASFDQFFTVQFPWKPYSSTYFWTVLGTGPLIGVDSATRLYLSLGLILTVVAFGCWIKSLQVQAIQQTIPATMLLYGLFFHIGLISFLFSIPFFFFSLALWQKMQGERRGQYRTEALLSLALLLAYFSHLVTFGLALLVVSAQCLVLAKGRGLLSLVRAAAPSLIFFALYLGWGADGLTASLSWSYHPLLIHLSTLLMPFNVFWDPMQGGWAWYPETPLLWAAFLVVTLLAGKRGLRSATAGTILADPTRTLLLTAAVLLGALVVLPDAVGGFAVAARVSYPAAFVFLALLPAGWDRRGLTFVLVFLVCLAAPVLLAYRTSHFQPEMRSLERAVSVIPPGRVLQPVITELNSSCFRTYPLLHSASWYNFRKGGFNPYTFARFPNFPVQEKDQPVKSPPPEWSMGDFQFERHQEGSDYFLLRTENESVLEDLRRHVPLAAAEGNWLVFGPNPGSSEGLR